MKTLTRTGQLVMAVLLMSSGLRAQEAEAPPAVTNAPAGEIATPEIAPLEIAADEEFEKETRKFRVSYLLALEDLYRKAQAVANLDGLLSVKQEIARFEKEGSLRITVTPKQNRDLHRLQDFGVRKWNALLNRKHQRIVEEVDRRVAALRVRVKALTQQGKLEEAVAIRNRVQTMLEHPEYLAAKRSGEAARAPAEENPTEMLLYYSFDRPPSNRRVQDHSAAKAHGTLDGRVRWMPNGLRGGGMAFGGGGIEVPVGLETLPLTVSLWIKPARIETKTDQRVFSDDDGRFGHVLLLSPEGRVHTHCYNLRLDSEVQTPPGHWSHLVIVWTRETCTVYRNGTKAFEKDYEFGEFPTKNKAFTLGRGEPNLKELIGRSESYHGWIDEFMAYGEAWSEEQVARIHARQKPR